MSLKQGDSRLDQLLRGMTPRQMSVGWYQGVDCPTINQETEEYMTSSKKPKPLSKIVASIIKWREAGLTNEDCGRLVNQKDKNRTKDVTEGGIRHAVLVEVQRRADLKAKGESTEEEE